MDELMEYQHGVTDAANPTGSNLAPSNRIGFTATVGQGSLEVTAGHGMVSTPGVSHTIRPEADASTGLVFSTEAGMPVPGGQPRPNDLVEIGGMKVKVAQAVRDGLIADPTKQAFTQPQSAPYSAPNALQQVTPMGPNAAPESAPDATSDAAADAFTTDVLPRVSPATTDSLIADLADGQFSEKTIDYLRLEGGQSMADLEAVRDAYASKVTAATGMNEAELQELWNSDRPAFNAAVNEMLKTGSTSAFQDLASRADEAAWSSLDTDAAALAWQDPAFPQALMEAGLEPIFDGGELSVNIPGRGVMRWADAVRQGVVGVSRHA